MNKHYLTHLTSLAFLIAGCLDGLAGANPQIPFYGSGIVVTPHYPIVGETTTISVDVKNNGDAPATNVEVKVSFNDWGVTFSGWQEMGTANILSIGVGDTETITVPYVFQNRTHTCVEAIIVGASENTDANDDRGQINLEVIHAGETFSYGVPIRNNGEGDVALLICRQLGDVPCRFDPGQGDLKPDVILGPGEEIIWPVELHIAPNEEVIVRLDAFNLLAADPSAPENHNHIELHIIGTTARDLKSITMAGLENILDVIDSRPLRNRVAAVANHIENALKGKTWEDSNRLNRKGAAHVFAQEIVAVKALQELLETDLEVVLKDQLNTAARQLTDADRILAQTAITDAGGDVDATALLSDGDAHREAGDYLQAVSCYTRAWDEATN